MQGAHVCVAGLCAFLVCRGSGPRMAHPMQSHAAIGMVVAAQHSPDCAYPRYMRAGYGDGQQVDDK
jgi:hypothetical protein